MSVGFGGTNLFYENLLVPQGQLAFREVGEIAGVADVGRSGAGMASGDFDNDGDMDIYPTNAHKEPNALYRNNGDRTFTDVAAEAGVEGNTVVGACVSVADLRLWVEGSHEFAPCRQRLIVAEYCSRHHRRMPSYSESMT